MNLRLFVAVTPSVAVLNEIAEIQAGAKQVLSDPKVRWQTPEKWHITLQFLGNIRSDLVDDLIRRLSAIRQRSTIRLTLTAPGAFPSLQRPRVLWLGFTGTLAVLNQLQSDITAATTFVGPVEETRDFTPHLTLARIGTRLRPDQLNALTRWSTDMRPTRSSWTVEKFELWQSTLGRSGSRYTKLIEFPIASSP